MEKNNRAVPEIKNYMEVCVKDVLPSVLESLDTCNCDRCVYDITALTLNALPPRYIVTRKGQMYAKLSAIQNQFDVDIVAAATKAAKLVAAHPRHDDVGSEDED